MKAWKIEHNRRCMELSLLAIESRFDPMNVLELMFDEAIENQRESGIIEARWDNNYIQDPNTGRMMGSRGGGLSGLRRDPKVYSNGGGKPKKPKYEPSPRKHMEGIDIDPKDYAALCSKFMMNHKNAAKGTLDSLEINGYKYKVMADGEGSLIVLRGYKAGE